MLSFLVIGYWILMLLVNSVPWIGQVAATVLIFVLDVLITDVFVSQAGS